MFFQLLHQHGHALAEYQFHRVGGNGAGGQDPEIAVVAGNFHQHFADVAPAGKEGADAGLLFHAEVAQQAGLAQVELEDEHFLVQQGIAGRKVEAGEAFAFAGAVAADEDGFDGFVFAGKADSGPDGAELLGHHGAGVRPDLDGGLQFAHIADLAQQGGLAFGFDVAAVAHFIVKEIHHHKYEEGHHQRYGEGDAPDELALGFYHAGWSGLFDGAAVGDGAGEGHGAFFPLLQQVEVDLLFHTAVAADLHQVFFHGRDVADAAAEAAVLAADVVHGYVVGRFQVLHIFEQRYPDVLDLRIEVEQGGVFGAGPFGKAAALQHQFVVALYQYGEAGFGQAKGAGHEAGVVLVQQHFAFQRLHQVEIGFLFGLLLVDVFGEVEVELGFGGYIRYIVGPFVAFHIAFHAFQFAFHHGQAVVEEFDGIGSDQVFVDEGLLVVNVDQGPQGRGGPGAVKIFEAD